MFKPAYLCVGHGYEISAVLLKHSLLSIIGFEFLLKINDREIWWNQIQQFRYGNEG